MSYNGNNSLQFKKEGNNAIMYIFPRMMTTSTQGNMLLNLYALQVIKC